MPKLVEIGGRDVTLNLCSCGSPTCLHQVHPDMLGARALIEPGPNGLLGGALYVQHPGGQPVPFDGPWAWRPSLLN